jgi:hypothetical protein
VEFDQILNSAIKTIGLFFYYCFRLVIQLYFLILLFYFRLNYYKMIIWIKNSGYFYLNLIKMPVFKQWKRSVIITIEIVIFDHYERLLIQLYLYFCALMLMPVCLFYSYFIRFDVYSIMDNLYYIYFFIDSCPCKSF